MEFCVDIINLKSITSKPAFTYIILKACLYKMGGEGETVQVCPMLIRYWNMAMPICTYIYTNTCYAYICMYKLDLRTN